MRTLERVGAVLIFAAITWLASGCERMGTPTEAHPRALVMAPEGCSVPSVAYPTIQSAVDDPTCSTIVVAAGQYIESVVIDRSLTLLGPNAGISWSGARNPEAMVTSPAKTAFDLFNGQDVTIDGFTINGDFGIYVSGSTSGTGIQNNIITGAERAVTLDAEGTGASIRNSHLISPVRSLHLSATPYTNLQVDGNRFSGTGSIFFNGNSSITGFAFNSNEVFQYANIASNITDGTVSDNTFDAPVGAVLDLQISLHNSTMTGNTFRGNDANACLQLFGSQFGLVPSHDVTISGNTFRNCGGSLAPWNFAIQLSPDIHHIHITANEISSGLEGVNTRDATPWDVTGLEIHVNRNNITDNASFGVRNGQMGTLDAECNWWGATDGPGPVGPGSGDNVSTNVDFTPWLLAPAPGGACAGGGPSGKVSGGGQVPVDMTGGTASFGFNAGNDGGVGSGHLSYVNQATGARLDCIVDAVLIVSPTKAEISGTCSANSAASSFTAVVEDNGTPGKGIDKFTISYGTVTNEGGTLISGNIQIQ